jgi:hypothetical protein
MGAGSSSLVLRFHMTAQDTVSECGDNSLMKRLHILVTGAEAKPQDVVKNINDELEKQKQRSSGSV